MKLNFEKNKDYQIGNVRFDKKTYKRIEEISKKENVSKQEVVRKIVEQVIDDVE